MHAPTTALGLIGLGAMGRNLGWRLAELGFPLTVYSYVPDEVNRFGAGLDSPVPAAVDPVDLVRRLPRPRTVLLMVTAGEVVDRVLDDLRPALEAGDLVIDGGNSHYEDTARRATALRRLGIGYAGAGISGGEHGARHGASLMVGADSADYDRARPVFEALAARVDDWPCATNVGPDGAGHFVKMVHNGIEYALMQLIAETWRTMNDVLRWDRARQQQAFEDFAHGPAAGYLVEITGEILGTADPEGGHLLDQVSDRAAQKGTGRWTVEAALELGVPVPTIAAAVSERMLSAGRVSPKAPLAVATRAGASLDAEALEGALVAGFTASFIQGFALLSAASATFRWQLDLAGIARIWQGGCIIRADLLREVEAALRGNPTLTSLIEAAPLRARLIEGEPHWRRFVAANVAAGTTPPGTSAALAWYDSQCAERLPTSLIQAQRDCFGAHGFERIDRDGRFHALWTRP